MKRALHLFASCALVAACTACADPAIATDTYSAMGYNGIAYNGILYNGIVYNALTYNALTFNGVQINGLDLADADAGLFLEYVISCALPAGAEVTGEQDGIAYAFSGALGLAPEWADGSCEEDCQRWVSACLLARVNARGERVEISMRAEHPALHPGPGELARFAEEDGTFFGNVFDEPQVTLAASPREDLALPRTCGPEIDACPIEVVGHSADACDAWSLAHGRRDCHAGDQPWEQAITVYLVRD